MMTLLEEARVQRPELRGVIDLSLELDAQPIGRAPASFAVEAAARLANDRPAIDPETLALDWPAVARRIEKVRDILRRHGAPVSVAVDASAARALTIRFLGGGAGDPLLDLLLTHALRPFLRPFADAALALAEAQRWTGGTCPACGGAPDLAVLEPEGGARRLLCSRCDAEWAYARVGCPRCGTQDPKMLAYFLAGDGGHRLYVCDACHGYLKTVDRRESWTRAPLPVERVLAVGLDLAAAQAGYGPLAAS
jgi:hypothetical protein